MKAASAATRLQAGMVLAAHLGLGCLPGQVARAAPEPGVPAGGQPPSVRSNVGAVADPRDFGAVGDGASHTVSATLGIGTLTALAAYTTPDGRKPYGFAARYPFGTLFNLLPEQPSASGSREIEFRATGTVGVQIPILGSAPAGATALDVGDLFVTSDQAKVGDGTPVASPCLAAGTVVSAPPRGLPGRWTLALSRPTSSPCPSGTLLAFSTRPPAGSHALPLLHAGGVNRGDLVSGAGIQLGTQVDWVNHARMEIVLSRPTTAPTGPGTVLTFVPSWLSRVRVGMQVQGPPGAVPPGDTVAGVDAAAGTVTLATALAAPVAPDSAMVGVSAARQTRATEITFYAPFTDAQAAGLEMDGLGIQAAIEDAKASGGGTIEAPAGTYRTSHPIVLPIYPPGAELPPLISLGGRTHAENDVTIRPVADFGPGEAAVSCGDPTAKSSNGRGLYQGPGAFCSGFLHDLRIRPAAYGFEAGLRPTWDGVPVAMDGIKEGPRLQWDWVAVSGFDAGALAAFDHTHLNDSDLGHNFFGLRMDDAQSGLFGDEVLDRVSLGGNAWAGLAISPRAYFNGLLNKPYLANSPYGIYCEAGPDAGPCIQGSISTGANDENLACGSIKDGGIQDGFVASGGTRTIANFRKVGDFELGRGGFGAGNVPMPAGGCAWATYFDIAYVQDMSIENVWLNDFAPVDGAAAHILRARRLDGFAPMGPGGFRMSGGGVWNVMQGARAHGQNLATGPNGFGGDFWYTGAWQYITLEGPTFRARPMPFVDGAASALALGTLLEYGTGTLDGVLGVQRAGQTAGAPIAGVACQDSWPTNPAAQQIAPIVCFGGDRVPLATVVRASPGQAFRADASTPGRAAAIDAAGGVAAAISMSAGAQDALTYAKPLWPGQE